MQQSRRIGVVIGDQQTQLRFGWRSWPVEPWF
jgi:hypothetical protein